MPLFSYSKSTHKRKLTPGPYRNYRTYKKHLRKEFYRKCIYCLLPDVLKGKKTFHVEHYLPREHFKSLENEYSNLYYCCPDCNRNKWDFYPKAVEIAASRFVPNPCDNIMFKHLQYSGAKVVHKSHAGEFTVDLLLLNDPDAVKYREAVILIRDSLQRCLPTYQQTFKDVENKLASETNKVKTLILQAELLAAQVNLDHANRLLNSFDM